MLGNCVIRNPTTIGGDFDAGALCETLLFFSKTHLLIDMATLANMAKANFLDDLAILLKEGHITGNYSPQSAVMFNENKGGLREHLFTVVRFGVTSVNRTCEIPSY